ncbi:MAG: bifunctional 5,10-methylenetetrahydrofolate dehydrogenase/5,10-methenyltetrahydrofolate cyclohydrolase, partial [Candidatus Omnitrophota bacterium]
KIDELNKDETVHGILIQLPLPKKFNTLKILSAVSPLKDVDGFHPANLGNLLYGKAVFVPCTPLGIMEMLKEYKIPIEGKNAVVLGRSNIVGKPISILLLNENATVTICHSKTKDLKTHTLTADILVSAIGKPNFVTFEMVKQGACVIDVGINRVDGKVVGDVDFENVKNKASYITPVPGGVGLLTIAMLLNNTVLAAEKIC